MNLPSTVSAKADVIAASVAGAGTSVMLSASQVLDPQNLLSFLSLLPAIIGPALAVYVNRSMRAKAARKKARAEFMQAEAETTKDPDEKRELLIEAAELRAEAEELRNDKH
jgi:hypothetical protein